MLHISHAEPEQGFSIDISTIPDHIRDDLAAATLALVRNILLQPDGRERLDAKIAARKNGGK